VRTFKDHFSEDPGGYAAHRPSYPDPLGQFLAAVAPATSVAVDCGCGSGQLSGLLASRFSRVVAIDASAAQIAAAAGHARISYRLAAAEATGVKNASADLIAAAQSAHWFDLPAFYGEVRRIGRPAAAIALMTYGRMRVDAAVDRVVRGFYDDDLGPYWPPERRQVEDGYRGLPFPFDEIAPPKLALHARWSLVQTIQYIGTWSAVRRLRRAGGEHRIDRFAERLACAWGDAATRRPVTWPLAMRVGRLRTVPAGA
jgi:SAM-dependent methyltransferase